MRARRWVVSLLLVVVATPARARAAPAPTVVGKVASLVGALSGTMPDRQAVLALAKRDEVWLDMTLATQARASARIAFAGVRGALIMGEMSRVVFNRWVTEQAREVKLRVSVGQFLLFFMPQDRPLASGEVSIDTPAGLVELHGTATCLRVEPDGTTLVAVLEGLAILRGATGGEARVPEGTWTKVVPGKAPAPPSPNRPRTGAYAFNLPADQRVEDPPHLDLRRLLDGLPKARHP
jgi:FecR protein